MTAAEILTEIKTVDGASSGLDADLLDGQEGTYYLNYNNFTNKPYVYIKDNRINNKNTIHLKSCKRFSNISDVISMYFIKSKKIKIKYQMS